MATCDRRLRWRRSRASSTARWAGSRHGRRQAAARPPPAFASRRRCLQWATATARCSCWTIWAIRWAGSGRRGASCRPPRAGDAAAEPLPFALRGLPCPLAHPLVLLPNQCEWVQVKVVREHSREVTDLCFDEQAEYLASASADGTVAVRRPRRPAHAGPPLCVCRALCCRQRCSPALPGLAAAVDAGQSAANCSLSAWFDANCA